MGFNLPRKSENLSFTSIIKLFYKKLFELPSLMTNTNQITQQNHNIFLINMPL